MNNSSKMRFSSAEGIKHNASDLFLVLRRTCLAYLNGASYLLFAVQPFFIEKPKDVETSLGSELILHCSVGGDPMPRVSWKKILSRTDNKMVPVKQPAGFGKMRNQGEAILKIAAVSQSDEGQYFCQAENEVGSIKAEVSISVQGKEWGRVSHQLETYHFSLLCQYIAPLFILAYL
jgi:hypothetical protein